MGKLSLVNLVVGILILIAVIVSYLGIMSAIGGIAGGPVQQAAPRHTITISGVGNRVTNTTGGTKECDPLGSNIQAEASISGGSANNEIKATAKCSLSNWSAVATAKDPGNGTSLDGYFRDPGG